MIQAKKTECSIVGGFGSGNWDRRDKKTSVEQCYAVDVNRLAREGKLRVGAEGFIWWTDQFGHHPFFVEFSAVHDEHCRPVFVLSYRWDDPWDRNGSKDIRLPILLQTSRPNYGGLRWWFTCPLGGVGSPCNRRVGKVYLPPGARYFGCRHCHGLVYRRETDPLEHADRFLAVQRMRMERLEARHGW
jgi:hypothetical protein